MKPGKAPGGTRAPAIRLGVWAVILLVSGLMLAGCDFRPARLPRMSDAWSKGLPLGMASLNNRVALAVDEAGGVHTAWVGLERELRFVRLDDRAGVVVDRALDLVTERPQRPQLALDADGQVHLTWLDKRERGLQLFYARLSGQGEVLQEATVLSPPEQRAAYSALVLDPVSRTVHAFWSDNVPSRPGLYHAALDWDGAILVAAEELVADGLWPTAQVDRRGFVHLAWRVEPEDANPSFLFAVYDPQRRVLGPKVKVSEPRLEMSMLGGPTAAGAFTGPWLGLDENTVYLAWMLEVRESGRHMAFTFYQAFAPPALGRPGSGGALDYGPPQTLADPVRVRVVDPQLTGDPSFLGGQPEDQVLACFSEARGPGNLVMLQSAVVDVKADQIAGQAVVSATPGASVQPNVARDGRGNLHLVWIDTAGFDRYKVIYASTAAEVQEVLNPTTVGEVLDRVLNVGFGAAALIGLVPLYVFWAMPAFFVLLGFYLVTHADDLGERRSAVGLGAAILVHAGVTIASTGGLLERLNVPGLVVAPGLVSLIRWVVPLVVTALATGAMVLYVRRTDNRSLFGSFAVFLLVDAILFTLVSVVPLLYG